MKHLFTYSVIFLSVLLVAGCKLHNKTTNQSLNLIGKLKVGDKTITTHTVGYAPVLTLSLNSDATPNDSIRYFIEWEGIMTEGSTFPFEKSIWLSDNLKILKMWAGKIVNGQYIQTDEQWVGLSIDDEQLKVSLIPSAGSITIPITFTVDDTFLNTTVYSENHIDINHIHLDAKYTSILPTNSDFTLEMSSSKDYNTIKLYLNEELIHQANSFPLSFSRKMTEVGKYDLKIVCEL